MRQYIKSYPDFPVNGVDFKCTASLCASQEGFALANNFMYSNLLKYCPVDKIIGIDARGFIFASVLCHRTRAPLVLARKPGKLPGSIKSASYELEYGKNTLELQTDSIQPGDTCIVIDDLVATGGTVCAVLDMVKQLRATTVAVATIIDLPELGGSDLVRDRNIPFYAGVEY
jgi:adenine phosphoribosyltransferase